MFESSCASHEANFCRAWDCAYLLNVSDSDFISRFRALNLFFYLYNLAIVQVRRPLGDYGVPYDEAGDDFGVRAVIAAHRDGAALDAVVFHQEDDFLAVVVAQGALRDERG